MPCARSCRDLASSTSVRAVGSEAPKRRSGRSSSSQASVRRSKKTAEFAGRKIQVRDAAVTASDENPSRPDRIEASRPLACRILSIRVVMQLVDPDPNSPPCYQSFMFPGLPSVIGDPARATPGAPRRFLSEPREEVERIGAPSRSSDTSGWGRAAAHARG